MSKHLFYLALGIAVTALLPGPLTAEVLVGLSWSSPAQLQAIAAASPSVRFVTQGKVLVSGDEELPDRLRRQGFEPFFTETYGPDETYFLVAYRHCPLHPEAAPSYLDPAGWGLLRLRPGDEQYQLPHFLYPLPETYSIRGWLTPRPRAKPVAALGAAAMEELLARIDAGRLQRDLRTLSLKDPDAASAYANLRTRFTVRPETYEATEYLRRELAAVLGEEAVEVQEFEVDADRLSSHLAGRLDDGPVDLRAYNVVGVLPGTDPQAGYYVICGHYDATGVRTPNWDWRADPAPGADDNGTGAALMLESARVLAGQQFPWSIRFIAFSGEELGLLGSRAYAAVAEDRGDPILGVLNFDMFGYNDLVDRIELATNPASRWLADLMVETNARYDLGLRVDVLEDQAARLSDHASFWARGYDALLAIENYLPNDSTHYAVREGLYRVNAQYHTVEDVPDSINWRLVAKTTRLAVATLAQYSLVTGLPNLAVFTGDLQYDGAGNLRAQVTNIGGNATTAPFQIRLSHCGPDSTGCETVYEAEHPAGLTPGEAGTAAIPWPGLGETVFLFEVDPDNRIPEGRETDNRAFQRLYLQPQGRIAVYPNPFHPAPGRRLIFTGLPLKSWVRVFSPGGELVWAAQEDDSAQRKLGARLGEILWEGLNHSGLLVNSGVYLYTITSADGILLERDRIALLR